MILKTLKRYIPTNIVSCVHTIYFTSSKIFNFLEQFRMEAPDEQLPWAHSTLNGL